MANSEGAREAEADAHSGSEGPVAGVIGVVGAGTMGAGIAQLACRAGAQALLHDAIPEALERGVQRVREGLAKEAARREIARPGRDAGEAESAEGVFERRQRVGERSQLASCELVIEAAPEGVGRKHELFSRLSEIVGAECVLATNTSSLPVTAIAAGASNPSRVVGMHFFNPAPLMRLLEVVAGEQSAERALGLAHATGEAMGKTVIRASDGPGFLVNRCNRPFGLEALRLLQERLADVQTIDRVCRMEGGFRMGPFELMDLVGIDTGLEVSKSFYEQSFGEPRWRPSPITARYAAAGLHGRKTGRGYYDYGAQDQAHGAKGASRTAYREQDPEPLETASPGHGEGVVVIAGEGVLAGELRAAAKRAGYEVRSPHDPTGGVLPALIVDCEAAPPGDEPRRGGPLERRGP